MIPIVKVNRNVEVPTRVCLGRLYAHENAGLWRFDPGQKLEELSVDSAALSKALVQNDAFW